MLPSSSRRIGIGLVESVYLLDRNTDEGTDGLARYTPTSKPHYSILTKLSAAQNGGPEEPTLRLNRINAEQDGEVARTLQLQNKRLRSPQF